MNVYFRLIHLLFEDMSLLWNGSKYRSIKTKRRFTQIVLLSIYFDIVFDRASQCGYVVSTLASGQGDPGSNPRAARKSCEVYPGLGILQPQWNPYPTLTPPSC